MKFKYKTQFLNEVQASAENIKDGKFVSQASLEQLRNLVPEDIDFEKNIDLIGVAFNAAVINQFNKNHDGIDTKTALAIKDYFVHKPTNVEHNKKQIVGHIVSSGFSRMYNDELLSSVSEDTNQPFNLALGAVVYSAANKEFAEMVLRSVDLEDEMHQVVSASWELGFNEYVIAAGSRNLEDAEIISDPKHVEELSQYLKAFDGEGKLNDGTEVYRLVVGDVYPLGIGFTANPAADVKGIYVFDDKKKEEPEDDSSKAKQRIEVDNRNYFSKNENNISQNGILAVNKSINNISTMEKQKLFEDFKALLEEKMPGHDFSQETVANVGRVIGDAIKSKNEQYEKELLALEEERQKLTETEEGIKADLKDLKSKLEAAESQVATLSEEIGSRKSEDAFNARMEDVDATYDLSEEDRKILASEVEAINLDEASFEEYKSKLSVMWAHKSKEYLAEQNKAFEEKLEAELQKRLQSLETSGTSEASDTSEETETEESEASEEVEEALENAETEEEEVIANNNTASAVEEVSLKEKFAEAFAKENISIKF